MVHGVASEKDVQQAEADPARARAESERAGSRLHDYGQSEDGSGFVLKSPVAGTVVERNLDPETQRALIDSYISQVGSN